MKKLLILFAVLSLVLSQVKSQMIINSYAVAAYDVDAQAFFTAVGLTDLSHASAINTFILNCKANGNWNQTAIYIYYGTTSATQGVNLKAPGTYTLSFTGVTHSSAGWQGDGTTNNVDTGIQPSTSSLTNSNTHIAFFTPTATLSATVVADIGLFQASNILELGAYGNPTVTMNGAVFGSASAATGAAGTANGFFYAEAPSVNVINFYKNTALAGSFSYTSTSPSGLTGTVRLGCRANNSGTITRRSTKMYSFHSIGPRVGNIAAYSNAVTALMTAIH